MNRREPARNLFAALHRLRRDAPRAKKLLQYMEREMRLAGIAVVDTPQEALETGIAHLFSVILDLVFKKLILIFQIMQTGFASLLYFLSTQST